MKLIKFPLFPDAERRSGMADTLSVLVRTGMPLLATALACVMLSACGKKGPPDPPGPPNEITWPRAYPTY